MGDEASGDGRGLKTISLCLRYYECDHTMMTLRLVYVIDVADADEADSVSAAYVTASHHTGTFIGIRVESSENLNGSKLLNRTLSIPVATLPLLPTENIC